MRSVDLCLDLGIKKHQEPGSSRTAQEPHLYDTITSSTAQGSGGSFKHRKPMERLVVVNHGWQSASTDGPKGGWSCVFEVAAMVAVVTSPTTAGYSVV